MSPHFMAELPSIFIDKEDICNTKIIDKLFEVMGASNVPIMLDVSETHNEISTQ